MPAGAFFAFHLYGPAMGAMLSNDSIGTVAGDVSATARATGTLSGQGLVTNAKATRLRNQPCTITAQGLMTQALPKAAARVAAVIKVNELSQDDVTGAVLEAKVEGSLSLKEAIRLLLAVAAGDATGLEGSAPVFKSQDGTKNRIEATYAAGERNVTLLDAS
jgi:hypothetical protein